jgi:hypothetical protein
MGFDQQGFGITDDCEVRSFRNKGPPRVVEFSRLTTMPTVIGVIFCCCGLYFFFFKEDGLLGLLVIATTFEAASAINFGERGIQPYYVVAVFIIARAIVNQLLGVRSNRKIPHGRMLLIFGLISVASALVLPFVFAGIPIYDPKIGIDDGIFIRPPLRFGINNVIQPCYLACHIATAFALLSIRFSAAKAYKAYLLAFYIEVFFVFAESFCQLAGISFPLSLVLNNPGYALWTNAHEGFGTRNPGTFSEPSIAGGFLLLYCVGFLAQYLARNGKGVRAMLALVASGMVLSTTSLAVLCLSPLPLLVRYSPFRFPWYLNLRQSRRIGLMLFFSVVPLIGVLLFSSGYREILAVLTVSKGESGSFVNRTAADLYSLQLLLETYGFGVGLGSSRPSSLLATLLSNVGLAATGVFLIFYFRLFVELPKQYAWFRWAAFALFLNMAISISDLTIPILWMPILLATQFAAENTTAGRKPDIRNLTRATV